MAYKIQLRRDIADNWTANNPLLLNGEIGIETDTLKFKIGNGTQRWNSIPSYAFKPGLPNGVATLSSDGKVPLSQLPDQISLDSEAVAAIQNALSAITTTNVQEGSSLYFTNARAVNAMQGLYDFYGSSVSALNAAKADATTKVNTALVTASQYATNKANETLTTAIADSESYTDAAINSLTTSDIEEGNRLYFTNSRVENIVGPLISETRSYIDDSLANLEAPSTISSTSDLLEGSNLYFTNARAVTATNAARTASLGAALGAVDDLRTEIQGYLNDYIPLSEINVLSGVAGLDSNSKISESAIPSTIARTVDISAAIAALVNSAPTTFDTLKEISDYISSDQSAASSLNTLVGTKLSSATAVATYAPINSPIFTGTVTIPAGSSIVGYATSSALAAGINEAKAYTDTAKNGINNSLGEYSLIADRNAAGGYAGLDSESKISLSAIPVSITLAIADAKNAADANINGTYTNGNSSSSINKITYGTNITPPSSGNSAGDIYIQF